MATIDAETLPVIQHLLTVAEIGIVVSIFLFGITTIQAYTYYMRFPEDRWRLKALVATVYLLELGHVIAVLHYFYTVSITQYGRPDLMFAKAPAGINIETLLGGYIACIVQIFFAHRARRLTGALYTTLLCFILSLARFAFTTAITVVLFRVSLAEFEQQWGWLVTVCLVVGAVVDIVVAVLLCAHLVQERKASFRRTTRLIDRIILMTLQTGLVTSLLTLAVMICFETMTKSYVWVALYMCLARVFSNSLLATLNARTTLRAMADTVHSLRFANGNDSPGQVKMPSIKPPHAVIEMDTSGMSQSTFDQDQDHDQRDVFSTVGYRCGATDPRTPREC